MRFAHSLYSRSSPREITSAGRDGSRPSTEFHGGGLVDLPVTSLWSMRIRRSARSPKHQERGRNIELTAKALRIADRESDVVQCDNSHLAPTFPFVR